MRLGGRPLSFRVRVLGLVLGLGIVPLVLIGLAQMRGATRSGERMLSERLEQATNDAGSALVRRWVSVRSGLLDVADWRDVRTVGTDGGPGSLTADLIELDPRVREVQIRTIAGDTLFAFDRSALGPEEGGLPPPTRPLLRVTFDVRSVPISAEASATIRFGLEGELLLPRDLQPASSAGMMVSLIDPATGASLLPIPMDASVLEGSRFDWGGNTWFAARRSFEDPPVELVLASPLAPYVEPFRRSARNSAFLLGAIALGALLAAVVLTSRMTRSLRQLVRGADAVTAGDLSHRVVYEGRDEIGRVAEAFNAMTESLQRTLRETASRESLAAMGELAASLAHEVRNPLTAVKIDLQSVEERLPGDSELRTPLRRSLEELDRLDTTVADALSIVRRGGKVEPLEIRVPIEAAAHAARPLFDERGATLDVEPGDPGLCVMGDGSALEQLFLNLLLNAAEALAAGGRARVLAETDGDAALISVEDDGPGIPEGIRDRIFEPLFSTKETGTGLGLTISRRIVEAHRGEMVIGAGRDGGTRVEIRLPRGRA